MTDASFDNYSTYDNLSSEPFQLGIVVEDDEETLEQRRLYKAALEWLKRGYNVVPQAADGSKHPAVSWKHLQEQRVTKRDLLDWYGLLTKGVGFITGAVSGVIVIESDGEEGEAVLREFEAEHSPLPETLTIRSGSGRGFHYHFKHPGYPVKTVANPSIKLDVKGDKGFCMLPPSLHKSGGRYEVVTEAELADLPEGLLDFIETRAQEAGGAQPSLEGPSSKDRLGESGNLSIPLLSPPPHIDEMAEMLKLLAANDAFEDRQGIKKDADGKITKVGWIEAGMALKLAYGDAQGFELWNLTHDSEQAIADAPVQWASFSSELVPGAVTVGTIIKAARDSGYRSQAPAASTAQPVSFTEMFGKYTGDLLNGKLLAASIGGRLLHIHETDNWLQYSDTSGWTHADPGEEERAAKDVVDLMRGEAAEAWKAAPDDTKVKALMRQVDRSSQAPQIRAMIDMAKSEPGITVRFSEFDADPMLLGVANGVLDLRTGKLLAPSPAILVSKRCPVAFDPQARCPRFECFLEEVQPDAEIRALLGRWIGYCLTGLTTEQKFVFFHGSGANGKSVLIETIAGLLGDYAHKMQTEVLMSYQRNPQGPAPEIVALKGVRYAYANETVEGRRLDEARVKDLTGGDTLTGRAPHGTAAITFTPSHKLTIAGNHKPEISDASYGMWRRVVLVPFEHTIPEDRRDPRLFETLRAEFPGILNWALRGLKDYQANGLRVPKSIAAATEAYRDEQDIIGDWLNECCETRASLSEAKTSLYPNYSTWCENNGHKPLAQGRLTRRLNERGFKLDAGRRTVNGVALRKQQGFGLR